MIVLKFGSANEVIQNLIPKFRRSSIISEKPDYLPQKLKTLTGPTLDSSGFFFIMFRS